MTGDPPRVALLAGDGPGPTLAGAAREILTAAGLRAEWSEYPVGGPTWRTSGTSVPRSTVEGCWSADAILLGATLRRDDPTAAESELPESLHRQGHTWVPPILRLKEDLGLWIDVRPVSGNGYDLVVYRPNHMGLYAGYEARPIPESLREAFPSIPTGPDTAVTLRVVTRSDLERLFRFVLDENKVLGRPGITFLEKPARMPATGAFAVEVLREIAAAEGENVRVMNADAALAHLVREPYSFDLVVGLPVMAELFSDLAAELAGGLALHASASYGADHALFQPILDPSPGMADVMSPPTPIGATRAGAMMARHLGAHDVAVCIEAAVLDLLENGTRSEWTPDIGGTGNTEDTMQALLERVQAVVTSRS